MVAVTEVDSAVVMAETMSLNTKYRKWTSAAVEAAMEDGSQVVDTVEEAVEVDIRPSRFRKLTLGEVEEATEEVTAVVVGNCCYQLWTS